MYSQLFDNADYLVRLLPTHLWYDLSDAFYRFGYRSIGSKVFEEGFIAELVKLNVTEFEDMVEQLNDNPEIMAAFQSELDKALRPSAAVFLARESELNVLINKLQDGLSAFLVTLETYRTASETGYDTARAVGLGSSAMEQACITLRECVIDGYRLRQWLIRNADEVRPVS